MKKCLLLFFCFLFVSRSVNGALFLPPAFVAAQLYEKYCDKVQLVEESKRYSDASPEFKAFIKEKFSFDDSLAIKCLKKDSVLQANFTFIDKKPYLFISPNIQKEGLYALGILKHEESHSKNKDSQIKEKIFNSGVGGNLAVGLFAAHRYVPSKSNGFRFTISFGQIVVQSFISLVSRKITNAVTNAYNRNAEKVADFSVLQESKEVRSAYANLFLKKQIDETNKKLDEVGSADNFSWREIVRFPQLVLLQKKYRKSNSNGLTFSQWLDKNRLKERAYSSYCPSYPLPEKRLEAFTAADQESCRL